MSGIGSIARINVSPRYFSAGLLPSLDHNHGVDKTFEAPKSGTSPGEYFAERFRYRRAVG
jgi:hypothetical protein